MTLKETIIAACPEIDYYENICDICDGTKCKGLIHHTRPIELPHVLRAIGELSEERITVDTDGNFREYKDGKWQFVEHGIHIVFWNLRETLENQTEEVKAFLEKLLVTE